ncbi:MAG: phosphonate ABC transporter, permease protein PhnE [Actinobacteria bacterium]|nr:phosphonate ABC transporter, permease protein PhnE [Actinomycetota bacterium]
MTSPLDANDTAAVLDTDQAAPRPTMPVGPGRWKWIIAGIISVALVWSISGLSIGIDRLLGAPGDAWGIARLMWPPDFATELERGVLGKVLESVYIAWIGTIIAATFSLPLSFLAASNVAPRWLRRVVRNLFNVIRSVPELIVAVILIAVTGLGPWAGALAIGLHSIGTLGKLSSEAIESIDNGPLEAVSSSGGRWVSKMRWGVLPQVLPTITSYWLFRFEINVRASAVLGLIGAGGVGSELVSQLNFRNFPQVAAVLIVTVAVVLTIDNASSAVRRRIISGGGGLPGDQSRMAILWADLTGRKT